MLPRNVFKIVEFLLRNTQEYNVNQVSRELNISIGSAHKILKDLEKNSILKARKLGNAIYYRLNLEEKGAIKLSELVLLESKKRALGSNPQAAVYAKDLEQAEELTRVAVLFGSIVERKQAKDVDVLFVTGKKAVKKLEDFCLKLSTLRMKRVNPLMMTANDLRRNIRNKDTVIVDVLRNGIVIYGEDEVVQVLGSI